MSTFFKPRARFFRMNPEYPDAEQKDDDRCEPKPPPVDSAPVPLPYPQ
jgi:hypothetical protein